MVILSAVEGGLALRRGAPAELLAPRVSVGKTVPMKTAAERRFPARPGMPATNKVALAGKNQRPTAVTGESPAPRGGVGCRLRHSAFRHDRSVSVVTDNGIRSPVTWLHVSYLRIQSSSLCMEYG